MRAAVVLALISVTAAGCGQVNSALDAQHHAKTLATDLLVQFTKAADASNRAVMADTDELSVAFAREADQATATVQRDAAALAPILTQLHYDDEARLLEQFQARFRTYRELDRHILDLAVENTNLKAQRLSFGPSQKAADDVGTALASVGPANRARDAWQVKALATTAMSAMREVQVLQAVHIADPDDARMTALEARMSESAQTARHALTALEPLASRDSRGHVAEALRAFEAFMAINADIITLSRRNTNVRSLALSLDQKRIVTPPCEESARALHDALAKRGYPAGR